MNAAIQHDGCRRLRRNVIAVAAALLLLCPAALKAREQAPDRAVSNVWIDVPLRQVVRDIGMQAGVTVSVDPAVEDTLISLEAEDTPLEVALRKITAGQGLSVREVSEDFFVIGSGRPDSPSFPRLARSRRVYLNYITAQHLQNSLPRELVPYVSSGRRPTEVLIYAPEDRIEQVMEIVGQLDVPRRQVVLEALVVELARNAGSELGIDWTRTGPDTVFSIVEQTENFVGTARYASVDEQEFRSLLITLRMLVERGVAGIRSRPRVATLNGEPAVIDISREQYFNILTDINGAFLRTELQVVRSGVVLEMTPHIGKEGDITVNVSTEVSDVASEPNKVTGAERGVSAGDLPVIQRRKARTRVRVREGDAIVIGGLVETQERDQVRRVPVLGSIPLLGALFRSKKREEVKKEIVIFITPRLMQEGESPLSERHEMLDVPGELQGMKEADSPPEATADAVAGAPHNQPPHSAGAVE
ncbi:MAG: hypothetical protein R6X33_08700 [Candidatus Brocadiia bacterium]